MGKNRAKALQTLFQPTAIAVIGASSRQHKASYHVVKGLVEGGFTGKIYPVNPKIKELFGLPVYADLEAIPGNIDMAYIAVPAGIVPQVLETCGKRGIPTAVVYSSGFGETGEAGKNLEKQLLDIAHSYGISFIGPNCIGVSDSLSKNTYYSDVDLTCGFTSLISHSGSLCGTIMRIASEKGVHFAKTISLGNCADITTNDLLSFFHEDDETKLIVMYIESIRNGYEFHNLIREINLAKPVIIWKSGRTESGSMAARSHTAAMASDQQVVKTVFRQTGIIACSGIEDVEDSVLIFQNSWKARGKRLAIVSAPGGVAVAAADACDEYGLVLAEFSDEIKKQLSKVVPRFGSAGNPVDLTTAVFFDISLYSQVIDLVMHDPSVDAVLIVAPAEMHPEKFAQLMIGKSSEWDKPFAISLTVARSLYLEELHIMAEKSLPLYPTVERAVKALSSYIHWDIGRQQRMKNYEDVQRLQTSLQPDTRIADYLAGACADGEIVLNEFEAKKLCRLIGMPVNDDIFIPGHDDSQFPGCLDFPLVLKGVVNDVSHKSELGLVELGINNFQELGSARESILDSVKRNKLENRFQGFLLSPMEQVKHQLIVGIKQDDQFGSVCMVGMGGTAVEVTRDVAFRCGLVTENDASAMIEELQGALLLKGYRGAEGIDIPALCSIISHLSIVSMTYRQIASLEINPIIFNGRDFVCVDAVVHITPAT